MKNLSAIDETSLVVEMEPEVGLQNLPEGCLVHILQALPDGPSLTAAIAAHRCFTMAAASADVHGLLWQPLAERAAWRLRKRTDESWLELYKRVDEKIAACKAEGLRFAARGF